MRTLAKFLIKAALLLIALFLVYLAYYRWDMGRLRTFCEEITEGMPVSQLPQIAERHGVDTRWLRGNGALDNTAAEWTLYVPAASSVGANVCAIRHDGVSVISAKIEID